MESSSGSTLPATERGVERTGCHRLVPSPWFQISYLLLAAERDDRIGRHGATGRHKARQGSYQQNDHGYGDERDWVEGADAKDQALEQSATKKRGDDSNGETECDGPEPLLHHHDEQLRVLCAQRGADTKFPSSLLD